MVTSWQDEASGLAAGASDFHSVTEGAAIAAADSITISAGAHELTGTGTINTINVAAGTGYDRIVYFRMGAGSAITFGSSGNIAAGVGARSANRIVIMRNTAGTWYEMGGPASFLDDRYVAVTGDTMTGTLTIDMTTPKIILDDAFTGSVWTMLAQIDDAFKISNNSKYPFAISANAPTNALRIAASGAVGIGTSTPVTTLQVQGTAAAVNELVRIRNSDDTLGGGAALAFTSFSGGNTTTGRIVNVVASGGYGLDFYTYSGSLQNRMGLDKDGNLTLSNGNLLISKTSAAVALADPGGRSYSLFSVADGSFRIYDGTATTYPFWLEAGTPNYTLYMKSSGRVGIGTTGPLAPLDINRTRSGTAGDVSVAFGNTSKFGLRDDDFNNMCVDYYNGSTWTETFAVRNDGAIRFGASGAPIIITGSAAPEGAVAAATGSLYLRTTGGSGTTLYVKESSPTTTTGWIGK